MPQQDVTNYKWPGRAFEPRGLPDLPGRSYHSAGPTRGGPTRDDHLDFAPRRAPPVLPGGFRQGKVLAGRNPLLLLRFAGALLLRLAERTFDG